MVECEGLWAGGINLSDQPWVCWNGYSFNLTGCVTLVEDFPYGPPLSHNVYIVHIVSFVLCVRVCVCVT